MKIPVSVVFEEEVLTWLNKKYPNPLRSSFINKLVKDEMQKETSATEETKQPQKARSKK